MVSIIQKVKTEERNGTKKEKKFMCMVSWCGVAIKFFLQHKSSLFYLSPVADVGGLRKIFNVLDVKNLEIHDML